MTWSCQAVSNTPQSKLWVVSGTSSVGSGHNCAQTPALLTFLPLGILCWRRAGDEQKQEASTRARRLSLAVEAKTVRQRTCTPVNSVLTSTAHNMHLSARCICPQLHISCWSQHKRCCLLLLLQGYVQHEAAAAATTAGAHAEAVVVTRASSSSSNCKQPGTPTQEAASQAGQDSNGSSNNNNNNSAADKPPASPQLHPTRSRRLSHLYTIQVGGLQGCALGVFMHVQGPGSRQALHPLACVAQKQTPRPDMQHALRWASCYSEQELQERRTTGDVAAWSSQHSICINSVSAHLPLNRGVEVKSSLAGFAQADMSTASKVLTVPFCLRAVFAASRQRNGRL